MQSTPHFLLVLIAQPSQCNVCSNRKLSIALSLDKRLQPGLLLFGFGKMDVKLAMRVAANTLATELAIRLSLVCVIKSSEN
jgi:hypothetical protein